MTLLALWHVVSRHWRFVLIAILGSLFFTGIYSALQPRIYQATAVVMLNQDTQFQDQVLDLTPFSQQPTDVNNQVVILKSQTLIKDVIRRLLTSSCTDSIQLLTKPLGKSFLRSPNWQLQSRSYDEMARIHEFQKKVCSVNAIMHTDLIELKVLAYYPNSAACIANTWLEAYQELNMAFSRQEVHEIKEFLKQQLLKTEAALLQSEDTLKIYKKRQKVAELSEETRQHIEQLASFEVKCEEARIDLESINMRLENLKDRLTESQHALLQSSLSSPVIESLQKQMGELIAEKAAYEQQLKATDLYSPSDVKLGNLGSRLSGIQQKLREETEKLIKGGAATLNPLGFSEQLMNDIVHYEAEKIALQVKVDALQLLVKRQNQRLESLPDKGLQLARLQREAQVNNTLFLMLRQKYEENRIVEAGTIGRVRIVDRAVPENTPVSPKTGLNLLLGFLMGWCLGIGGAVLLHNWDSRLHQIEDVASLKIPVWGVIPIVSQKYSLSESIAGNKTVFSESYRALRTHVLSQPGIKRLLITSPGPGEGKSTTVTNLAIAMGQWGLRVLIVDADLRKPVQQNLLPYSAPNGLTHVLSGRQRATQVVYQTNHENVWLLPSGPIPEGPAELLGSTRMHQLLQTMETQYDLLIVDTPPFLAVTDAAVLMNHVDCSLLVLKAGFTTYQAAERCLSITQSLKIEYSGLVLNGLPQNGYGYYPAYTYTDALRAGGK